jgi:hypothetical protein
MTNPAAPAEAARIPAARPPRLRPLTVAPVDTSGADDYMADENESTTGAMTGQTVGPPGRQAVDAMRETRPVREIDL